MVVGAVDWMFLCDVFLKFLRKKKNSRGLV